MISIRPLQHTDREVIYVILQQTDMFTPAEIDVAMELIDIFLFDKNQKDYRIYVAENESRQVVGYVCYGPTPATEGTYDIYWIAVSPGHQRSGIGKKLLLFVENEVRKQKGRLLIVETSSREKYAPTRKFYEMNGFTLTAEVKDFYRSGDHRSIYTKYLIPINEEDLYKNGNVAKNPTKERNYSG